MKKVKDYIEKIRRESMGDLTPVRATELLNKLSALLGTVNEQWVKAEMEYNRYYEKMTQEVEKVTEARVRAKASNEYEKKLEMEGLQDVTKELLRAMKYFIKVALQEQQESKYYGN